MEATRTLIGRQTQQPRHILGFVAISISATFAFAAAATWALAATDTMTYLIPIVLGLAFFVAVGLIVTVLVFTAKDPSKLMLGVVSGTEYLEIQHLLLGDSVRGERLVEALTPVQLGPVHEVGELASGDESELEEEE